MNDLYFYVVSSLGKRHQAQELINFIEGNSSWKCSHDWTSLPIMTPDDSVNTRLSTIQAELDAIDDSQVVIVLPPLGRGSHVEIGYALGAGVHLIALGERDKTCLAYDLLTWVPNRTTLLDCLMRLQ